MTQIYHQNNFGTALTSNVNAGDTTSPLNSIPSISAPFYIAFDATNVNGHYEVRQITSKTATNVLHSALTYPHTTSEEVRMVVPAEEMDDISARLNAGDYFYSGMARQAIMNGNFDVWQRGTSIALADVTKTFLADRWHDYVSKDGGTLPTLTRNRQLLTSGDIVNAFYFTRLTTNGAGTSLGVNSYGVYSQTIENGTRNLCGLNKKVTISFYAKSDIANKRITPSLRQSYGTGGSPSSLEFIKGTPITLTSVWTKYTATFTTNTLASKTFGTNGDDYLELDFWYMWGTTAGNTYVQTGVTAETFIGAGNIDIAQVQLCAGDVALPFQPKSYEEELRACKRYYQYMGGTTAYEPSLIGMVNAATSVTYYLKFETEMRIAPASVTVVGNWQALQGGTTSNASSIAMGYTNPRHCQISAIVSGLTVNSAVILRNNNDTTAQLQFNAEL